MYIILWFTFHKSALTCSNLYDLPNEWWNDKANLFYIIIGAGLFSFTETISFFPFRPLHRNCSQCHTISTRVAIMQTVQRTFCPNKHHCYIIVFLTWCPNFSVPVSLFNDVFFSNFLFFFFLHGNPDLRLDSSFCLHGYFIYYVCIFYSVIFIIILFLNRGTQRWRVLKIKIYLINENQIPVSNTVSTEFRTWGGMGI